MLIVSPTKPAKNRAQLATQLQSKEVPSELLVERSRFRLRSLPWRAYWKPALPFFEVDLRLIQRLNRLKRAWSEFLDQPTNLSRQRYYCWRYFGLLHHTLKIMAEEPSRPKSTAALRLIVGFESFPLSVSEVPQPAACSTSRNPIFCLSQLVPNPHIPSPRHLPLVLTEGSNAPFYCYRQLKLSDDPELRLFLYPSTHMLCREYTFSAIDRLTRLLSHSGDPYWRPRAHHLADKLLAPLLKTIRLRKEAQRSVSILDLGAGTGQLLAAAWKRLRDTHGDLPEATFHFVEGSPVSTGRSFGLSRSHPDIEHVEYSSGNYRALADDEDWLNRCGPFEWVIISRVLDNVSNFTIDSIKPNQIDMEECLPHRCLSPRMGLEGPTKLQVSTTRKEIDGGMTAFQYSLQDYFVALRIVNEKTTSAIEPGKWYLPVRRFNPACQITPSGQSVLKRLMQHAQAIVIADLDLRAEHLLQHHQHFQLAGTICVQCELPGSRMEAHHFVITTDQYAANITGKRLW